MIKEGPGASAGACIMQTSSPGNEDFVGLRAWGVQWNGYSSSLAVACKGAFAAVTRARLSVCSSALCDCYIHAWNCCRIALFLQHCCGCMVTMALLSLHCGHGITTHTLVGCRARLSSPGLGSLLNHLAEHCVVYWATVQPWIQSAPTKKYLIMANPAHNAPQN
jgi:hypothetical protein